jgi:hypothetical protein
LPVRYLGREVARTDASGTAHVLLQVPPQESFTLELLTDEAEGGKLHPTNPTATFLVGDRDEVFVLDQKFVRDRIVRRGPPQHPGPRRIGSSKRH